MIFVDSMSLYIHFPWCLRKCPYCDFNSYLQPEAAEFANYTQALIRDLEHDRKRVPTKTLQSIYLGGGTPTLFATKYFRQIFEVLQREFVFTPDIEITIEANPGTVDLSKMRELRELGINRVSLGVQSFNDKFLAALNRIHSAKQATEAIAIINQAGFINYNIDLMFGLPNQTTADVLADLQVAVKFLPQHLSWYQLTLEPETPLYAQSPILPDQDLLWEMSQSGEQYLAANGFLHYEVAAFARNDCFSKHNTNYWEFGDYLGIGAGAHSKITAEVKVTRFWKIADPVKYLQSKNFIEAEKIVNTTELPFEFMLNALRLYRPIPKQLFSERTGLDIAVIGPQLHQAQDLGLLEVTDSHLIVTAKGRRFLSDLMELFL